MFDDEKKALEALDKRIESLSEGTESKKKSKGEGKGNFDLAIRIISDLIAGVVVGLGIGMVLDDVFDKKPLFMIIFLFMGSIAGFLNVYRTVQAYEKRQEQEVKKEDI